MTTDLPTSTSSCLRLHPGSGDLGRQCFPVRAGKVRHDI